MRKLVLYTSITTTKIVDTRLGEFCIPNIYVLHRIYLRPHGDHCGDSGRSDARHLLGPERHHSPSDLSHGPAHGGGMAAGKAPKPALCHSGSDLRINHQTKIAPALKKRRGCSTMRQERRAALGGHLYHVPAHRHGPEYGCRICDILEIR